MTKPRARDLGIPFEGHPGALLMPVAAVILMVLKPNLPAL